MGIFSRFKRSEPVAVLTGKPAAPQSEPRIRAALQGESQTFTGLNDPAFLEYIRRSEIDGGDIIGEWRLHNTALFRCVKLIADSISMLPVNLIACDETKAIQANNPAHKLLNLKPNDWQTPSEFKAQVMIHALLDGNGYARVIRSPINNKPIAIVPLRRWSTRPYLMPDYSLVYEHVTPFGESLNLPASDILHIRDTSLDSIHGISRLRLGRRTLDLAEQAENSTDRLFRTGVMAGGAIEVPKELSDNAYTRMKASLQDDYAGADNAGSWMVLEEGAQAKQFAMTAQSSQQIENRNHQIEEVARLFGIPRPLLMMSDTSWGAGIETLGLFFLQYGLAPWLKTFEEALNRVLLTDAQTGKVEFRFDESALLRGTLADQSKFFATALGQGGGAPWMTPNEVRACQDLPALDDETADKLPNAAAPATDNAPTSGASTAGNEGTNTNEPKTNPANQG
ncbi:phage portal protein [Paraburkholderia sp. Ac-20340]|uniref:phage portal protein n=1 Tax=Paraburkholderia sp. Ac-20340 TaxID=2703888 RepID=UPI00197D5619|nr:phage portal protein [Paraburkholderia sp. Ac-20340]MBN3852805.1 phage portal protein [Paraburkholderia sp. Ac-20340]